MSTILELSERHCDHVKAKVDPTWNNEGGDKRFLGEDSFFGCPAYDPNLTINHAEKMEKKVTGRSGRVLSRLLYLHYKGGF